MDVFLLQETLLPANTTFRISGYRSFFLPYVRGHTRGCAILVRNYLRCEISPNLIECGEGVEVQAVILHLPNHALNVYNIYRSHNSTLDLSELFTLAAREPVLLGGDFNSHHPFLSSPRPSNAAGRHLLEMLTDPGGLHLINDVSVPTHIMNGRLDLSLVSTHFHSTSKWSLHPTLTSDHFAICIFIEVAALPPPRLPPPAFNMRLANWSTFHATSEDLFESTQAPEVLEDQEQHIIQTILTAARSSIPLKKDHFISHRDHWIHGPRVKELNHRVNSARKAYRRDPNPQTRLYLQSVVRHVSSAKAELRNSDWISWCRGLNAHTGLREMWKRVASMYSPRPAPPPSHPDPLGEAERLAAHFASRTSSALIPPTVQARQSELAESREQDIALACTQPDETDHPFTPEELSAAMIKRKDTAPGVDGVTYSMLWNLGNTGQTHLLNIFNQSLSEGRLPEAWKSAVIQPIPKPKDPGAMRPISLLSCLSKVMERLILARLKWKVGALHPSLFAYLPKTGTADCLITMLGTLRRRGLVVFIDLEKAFELANPAAILSALARKGVRGHLLKWLRDFFTGRGASVRFQGAVSTRHKHVLGTPQGSILSPFLFNILVEGLLSVSYGPNIRLLCYADDLALVCPTRSAHRHVQVALNRLESKCKELGLKVNARKSCFMSFGMPPPNTPLLLGTAEIPRSHSHQYLGVWLDEKLSFQTHVRYLRERTVARTRVLKAIAWRGTGASFAVKRLFYIQAIRSVIDYSALCLCDLSDCLISSLEVAQNDGLRTMLFAPMWTRLHTLRAECGLPSLHHRILARTSISAAKFRRRRPEDKVSVQLLHAFQRPVSPTPDGDWLHSVADAMRKVGIDADVLAGDDLPHPDFVPPPPWQPKPFSITRPNISNPKATLPALLRQDTLRTIQNKLTPDSMAYFTDGSASEDGAAGAAFVCGALVHSWRLSNGASAFQSELHAIELALEHAATIQERNILIFTDSLSSLEAIDNPPPFKDHVRQLSHILCLLQKHASVRNTIHLHWVPGHVGIAGNERADKAARAALTNRDVTHHIPPSLSLIKSHVMSAMWRLDKEAFGNLIADGSASAAWYARATNLEPLVLPANINPSTVTRIHRLRLGFRGRNQMLLREPDPCEHCFEEERIELLHYVLRCPCTERLRFFGHQTFPCERDTAASIIGAVPLKVLAKVASMYPPPR